MLVPIPHLNLTVGIVLTILVADYLIHVGYLFQVPPPGPTYPIVFSHKLNIGRSPRRGNCFFINPYLYAPHKLSDLQMQLHPPNQ